MSDVSPVDPGSLAASYPSPRRAPWDGFALAADAAVRHLNERLGLDLWLVTHVQGSDQTVIAAAGHWAALASPGTAFSWRDSFCLRMIEQQGPTIAADVLTIPGYAPLATGVLARVRSYVGVPLEGDDGALFGTLCAFAGAPQPEALGEALSLVELVGQMLSTILAREQQAAARSQDAASAYALAERDQLTGLLNRRGWQAALAREEQRLLRYGSHASVLVLDVDDLRGVNDVAGPDAGDALLVRCAGVLKSTSRPGDVPGRLDGDEFAVLAIECDALSARALVTRMRVKLRAAGVQVSIGAATRRPGEGLDDTTARAEASMKVDKRRRQRLRPSEHSHRG